MIGDWDCRKTFRAAQEKQDERLIVPPIVVSLHLGFVSTPIRVDAADKVGFQEVGRLVLLLTAEFVDALNKDFFLRRQGGKTSL